MKAKLLRIAAVAALASLTMVGCKSNKHAGYAPPPQLEPVTTAQQQAASRGLKLQAEECEELALEAGKNYRESGNGVSDKESFATNLALLDARSKLAQQLEVLVNGLVQNFNQQHGAAQAYASVDKASQIQRAYFEQFLTNTRPIRKNTYVKEDGRYNVYVCVELSEQEARIMHKKLSEDKKISIDFAEHQFMQELEKAKEDYRQKQLSGQ
jgi:hypothetical protein